MHLKEYLKLRKMQNKTFAEIIGVTGAAISNYISWKRIPTLEIARKIEKATRGKVKIDDLFPPNCPKAHPDKKKFERLVEGNRGKTTVL